MATCEVCGKHPVFGRTIQHQGGGGWFRRATKKNRMFKPNVQNATLTLEGGVQVKLKICTKCLKTANKAR